MTVHGRVDCYINPSDSSQGRRQQEIFANICDFFTGSFGQALGISLVAASWTGGAHAGTGLGFWDGSSVYGTGGASSFTWAVWRFNAAPRGAFDMLLLCASGSGQSLSPFNVSTNAGTVFGANNSHCIIGWSCAVTPTGSHPWNGTTNIGNATLGTMIWSGSVGFGSGALGVLPRANATDASFGTNHQYMVEMHDDNEFSLPLRLHIIATEGSLTVVQDAGLLNDYRIFHFGSYAPRPGMSADAPYFMICGQWTAAANQIVKLYNALGYGNLTGISFSANQSPGDGGIMAPTLGSGSKSAAVVTLGNQNVDSNIGAFNSWVNQGTYDQLPFYICMQDTTIFNGIMGASDYLSFGYGMSSQAVNIASSSCAFGNSTPNSLKVIVPWSGAPPGSVNNVRTGREF